MGGARRVAFAQRAKRCISATESPPPETATAPGHGAPAARSCSMLWAKAISRSDCLALPTTVIVGPRCRRAFPYCHGPQKRAIQVKALPFGRTVDVPTGWPAFAGDDTEGDCLPSIES